MFGSGPIEARDIRLADDAGHALLANGDFARGLDNWIFTDDSHVSWRMLNQYLMLFFEMGLLGLGAYLALTGSAMLGALRAAGGGPVESVVEAAAVAGAIAAFLASGLFDNVLEAPRLAALFFLACFCGLIQRSLVPPAASRAKQAADDKGRAEDGQGEQGDQAVMPRLGTVERPGAQP